MSVYQPPQKKKVHTLSISCVESLSGAYFSHSHTSVRHTTHTHSQLPLGLPPVRRPPFLSCTSPLCPAEGIPGLRPEGLSQKFPLKQAPIIACGVSGGLGPSPFFPVTAPTRRRENSGGLAQTVDTEAGTVPAPYTTCASAVHPCVSVCSGVPGLRAPL